MDWQQRISIDSQVCHGKPCIKGTRVMVSVVLDYLAAGEPEDEVLRQHPSLAREDVRAAVAYAAWLAREEEEHQLHTASRA